MRRWALLLALLACSRSKRTPAPTPAPPVPPPLVRTTPLPDHLTPTGAPVHTPDQGAYFLVAMAVTRQGLLAVWHDSFDRSLWAVPPGRPGIALAEQYRFIGGTEPPVVWDGERMLTVSATSAGYEVVTLTPGGTLTRAPLPVPSGARPSHLMSAGGIVVELEEDEPRALTMAAVSLDHGASWRPPVDLALDAWWSNGGELTLDGRPHWMTRDTHGARLWGADRQGQISVLGTLPASATLSTDVCNASERPFTAWISKHGQVFSALLSNAADARPIMGLDGASEVLLACQGSQLVLEVGYGTATDDHPSVRLLVSSDAGQHWSAPRVFPHAGMRALFGAPPHARFFFDDPPDGNAPGRHYRYVDQATGGFGPAQDTGLADTDGSRDWRPYPADPGAAADVMFAYTAQDWRVRAVPR